MDSAMVAKHNDGTDHVEGDNHPDDVAESKNWKEKADYYIQLMKAF